MANFAKVSFLFAFVFIACNPVPNKDNTADAGAANAPRCSINADCGEGGTCITSTGLCRGPKGEDGKNGLNGEDGADGRNGTNGINGEDGRNGTNGEDGEDGVSCQPQTAEGGCIVIVCGDLRSQPICSGHNGTDGEDGAQGPAGQNGADGTGCSVDRVGTCVIVTCGNNSERVCDGEEQQPQAECNQNADCTNEPADRCAGENTLLVYVGTGECQDNGTCYYGFERVNCAHGCFGGQCNSAPEPEDHDIDDDGFDDISSGGTDCDDNNDTVHPGADEQCGDGIDNDCDGGADNGCDHPAPQTFVEFTYQLPEDNRGTQNEADDIQALTNMFTAQGCVGSQVDYSSETDGPNGRLVCNTPWMEYGNITHNATDMDHFTFRVAMAEEQGFEGNVYWEYFNDEFSLNNPHWACSANFQRFGTLTAITSTGVNLPIHWVDNRSGGCNPWVYWPNP